MVTEYAVTVNRPLSTDQAMRVLKAVLDADKSQPVPIPGSGGVGPNGIRYGDIWLQARASLRVVEE